MFLDLWGEVLCEIPLGEETYRVRYAARGMDARYDDTEMEALWFWPSPHAPDAVVKQTSKSGAYWHAEIARINELHPEASRGLALSAGPVFGNDP
jgi:hypothetical protein